MSSLPVRPEFGPALPAAIGRRWPRAGRLVLPAVGVLLALVLAAALVLGGAQDGERIVVERGAVSFNLRHEDRLQQVAPRRGELLRLEQRRADGLFLQSFSARPLTLPRHERQAAGVFPTVAERLHASLAATVPGYVPVSESRVRINQVPGYAIAYKGRLPSGRRFYESRVLLVPDLPGARRGVELVLRATPAAGVPGAAELGTGGALKLPLRSFRFGTEAP